MPQIIALSGSHDRESFDCGKDELNKYLREIAPQHMAKNVSRTFVMVADDDPNKILGYYTLTTKEIPKEVMPKEYKRHPRTFPGVLLGKLAVSTGLQRQGIGEGLMMHALMNALTVSETIGGVAVFVDAIDQEAWDYYHEKYGFHPLPDDPKRLFLPMRQVAELFG